MKKSYYKEFLAKDEFKIDFATYNDCNGVYSIEVKPLNNSKLSVNSYDECTTENPFKISSPVPMVSGNLEFEGEDVLFVVRLVLG